MGERPRHRRVTYRGSRGDLTSQCHVCGRWVRAENMYRHQGRHRVAASSCLLALLVLLTAAALLPSFLNDTGWALRLGPRRALRRSSPGRASAQARSL